MYSPMGSLPVAMPCSGPAGGKAWGLWRALHPTAPPISSRPTGQNSLGVRAATPLHRAPPKWCPSPLLPHRQESFWSLFYSLLYPSTVVPRCPRRPRRPRPHLLLRLAEADALVPVAVHQPPNDVRLARVQLRSAAQCSRGRWLNTQECSAGSLQSAQTRSRLADYLHVPTQSNQVRVRPATPWPAARHSQHHAGGKRQRAPHPPQFSAVR